VSYDTEEDQTESAFEKAVRDYFVALRWHERAMNNVQRATQEVARALESKKQSRLHLANFAENPDEVARTCSALLDDL
jgi:hypothetical protein